MCVCERERELSVNKALVQGESVFRSERERESESERAMDEEDGSGVRIARRAPAPRAPSERRSAQSRGKRSLEYGGVETGETETRTAPAVIEKVYEVLRRADAVLAEANDAALEGVQDFVWKKKWARSNNASKVQPQLSVAAVENGGSGALNLAPGIAEALRDAGHLAVVWTSTVCPSAAHALGSAVAQLKQNTSDDESGDIGNDDGGIDYPGVRRPDTKRRRMMMAAAAAAEEAATTNTMAEDATDSVDERRCKLVESDRIIMDDGGRIVMKKTHGVFDGKVEGQAMPEHLIAWYDAHHRRDRRVDGGWSRYQKKTNRQENDAHRANSDPGKVLCFVFEAAECFEPMALANCLQTLASLAASVPAVAIICLATAVTAIPDMLPSSLAERLRIETFRLDSAKERLDVLVEKMLLSSELPPIVLGPKVCALVEEYILHYDYSSHALQRALQVAALQHYHPHSAPSLLVPCMSELHSANAVPDIVNRMSATERAELQKCLKDEVSVDASARRTPAKHLQSLCESFDREWLAWTTAIKLLHKVTSTSSATDKGGGRLYGDVSAAEKADLCASYPLWRLWTLASRMKAESADSDANRQMQYVLSKAMHVLRSLDEEALMGIMLAWLQQLNELRGAKGKALIVHENRIKRKVNEITKLKQQQQQQQQQQQEQHAMPCARDAGDNGVENGNERFPAAGPNAEVVKTATTDLNGNKPARVASKPSAIIRGTGTNARRRGELLHQFVANVSSASRNHAQKQLSVTYPTHARGTGTESRSGSLGQWMAEELAAISKLLVSPIQRFPLMQTMLCFDDADAIRDMLLPDPRTSVMRALSRPATILKCSCCPSTEGPLTKTMEDACIAYGLLNEQGGSYNLYDWFVAFCRVYGDTKMARRVKRAGRRSASAASKAAEAVSAKARTDLQARFTRAVAELQLLGLFKSGRRSRAENVTRLIFTIDPVDEDDGE